MFAVRLSDLTMRTTSPLSIWRRAAEPIGQPRGAVPPWWRRRFESGAILLWRQSVR